MKMKLTISDAEVQKLMRAADALGAALEARVQRVIEEYAEKIMKDAVEKAPKRTGRLKSKISTELGRLSGAIIADVFYAPYVEYGTRKAQAKPFMHPAFEAYKNDFIKDLKEALT